MSDKPIKVGAEVRLKPDVRKARGAKPKDLPDHETATVLCLLSDVEGGVRLDQHLHGFRYWHVADLEIVE